MFRPASLCMLAPSLVVCAALVVSSGCDKSSKKPTDTPDTVAEPEPEPEPEPPKPSNEPSQTWAQQWATPSGKPTANLVGVRNGHVYALAGEYLEMGTPSTHLVAFAEDGGTIAWTYAGKQILTADGASDVLVAVKAEDKPVYVAVKTGKKTKPKKGEAEAITPFDAAPGAEGCTATGADLTCGGWTATVTEAGPLSGLTSFNDQVCYAVANSREIRCRAMSNGDLAFAVAVPAVPDAKEPGNVNFGFAFANGKLYVGNYDGTVLAFAQAGGGGDETDVDADADADADAGAGE